MDEIIISVKNLIKTYRIYDKPIDRLKESFSKKIYSKEFNALQNISFDIRKGENIGIIGTNGSGKSTLLKIITGVLNQTSGTVNVDGQISALLELGTGFNPEYTGIENIYLNGTMMGLEKKEVQEREKDILEFADIGDFVYQPVKTYSSGMFARLAFAVAIHVKPDILIVDEALSVGDLRFQIKCMSKMKTMIKGGTTVLFVSHDTNAIRRFCSKVIWLNKGNLITFNETNKVIDEYMDFLKCAESPSKSKEKDSRSLGEKKLLSQPNKKKNIAEIVDFKLYNKRKEEVEDVLNFDELVEIEIEYEVYEIIPNPVLGVALKSVDDDYVCGLNTLLDNVEIPWKIGSNRISLNYPDGLRVLGGKYYFDCALEDETASIPIQYISHIKDIIVTSEYVGEGRFIIPHNWFCIL